MGNTFCKIEDNQEVYVLVDENNQPLSCSTNGKCYLNNFKKILENTDVIKKLSESDILEETSVTCSKENNGYVTNYRNEYETAIPIGYGTDIFRDFEFGYGTILMGLNMEADDLGYINKEKIMEIQKIHNRAFQQINLSKRYLKYLNGVSFITPY